MRQIGEITSILGDGTKFEQEYNVIVEPLPGHVNEVLFIGYLFFFHKFIYCIL